MFLDEFFQKLLLVSLPEWVKAQDSKLIADSLDSFRLVNRFNCARDYSLNVIVGYGDCYCLL